MGLMVIYNASNDITELLYSSPLFLNKSVPSLLVLTTSMFLCIGIMIIKMTKVLLLLMILPNNNSLN